MPRIPGLVDRIEKFLLDLAHCIMPVGFQSARDLAHYAQICRLADPDLATSRMTAVLRLQGT